MGYQAPEKTITLKGEEYKGLNIEGKPYAPVNRRIESAHKNGGYSMIRCDWIEVFGIKCCEVEIIYKEQHFIGTSELKMNFKNPISDGQTSALGRALAEAGFDIETSIASAEDMEAVIQSNGHTHIIDSEPLALPDPEMRPPDGMNWQEWAARLAKSKGISDRDQYLQHLTQATGKKNNYQTADYQKAVNFFITLPDPVVKESVVSEQTNE